VPSHTFGSSRLLSVVNKDCSAWGRRDAFRALKGKPANRDVWKTEPLGKTSLTHPGAQLRGDSLASHQGRRPARYSSSIEAENAHNTYERSKEDSPRLQHELGPRDNSFGDVTKAVTVRYGRKN